MIVNWTKECMKVIPVVAMEGVDMTALGGKSEVILYPGYNNIPDPLFQAIEPHIRTDIATKRITIAAEITKGEDGEPTKIKPLPIKQVPISKLKTMMEKTVNLESLREWLDKETRPEARLIIQSRIEVIEKELKKGGQDTSANSDSSESNEDEE